MEPVNDSARAQWSVVPTQTSPRRRVRRSTRPSAVTVPRTRCAGVTGSVSALSWDFITTLCSGMVYVCSGVTGAGVRGTASRRAAPDVVSVTTTVSATTTELSSAGDSAPSTYVQK